MIGLDTETVAGSAVLACTSDGRIWLWELGTRPFDWLLGLGEDAVCYNLTYDAQAFLLHTDRDTLWRLERLGKADFEGIHFEWIRGKRLIIERDEQRICLYDCAQFFHQSLDSAAQKFLGESKLQIKNDGIDVTDLGPALD